MLRKVNEILVAILLIGLIILVLNSILALGRFDRFMDNFSVSIKQFSSTVETLNQITQLQKVKDLIK